MKLYKILWRNFLIYLILFVCLIVLGTAGYMLIEHYSFLDALYMTVITLASVGYSEVKPLDHAGKIFTIILILSDLAIVTYIAAKVSRFLFDGEFRKVYNNLSMENNIQHLEGHVIVCGLGRNGSEAIRELKKSKLQFVVIDKERKPYDMDLAYFIEDDATLDDVLRRAGIKRAKAILITLPNDAENMFIVLEARELNPGITIISRASKDTSVKRLKAAGANNVIMPDKLGGVHMASLVLFPDVKEFIDVMSTYQNNGNTISELVPTRQQTLQNLNAWMQSGATILGIRKAGGDYIVNPEPAYQIDLSDRLIVLGNEVQTHALKKII